MTSSDCNKNNTASVRILSIRGNSRSASLLGSESRRVSLYISPQVYMASGSLSSDSFVNRNAARWKRAYDFFYPPRRPDRTSQSVLLF